MDTLLASIIGGGGVTVDVTVNGKPLSSLITELAAALKSHQEQINELRDYTYKTDEQMWNRISNLEDGVSKINTDLGFEQRGPLAIQERSTYAAIQNLERGVKTLDNKRKGTACATALSHNEAKMLRERYFAWLNLATRNHRLRDLTRANQLLVRQRYHAKWQAAVKIMKRRRAIQKGIDVLKRFNEHRLARRYYDMLLEYREVSLKMRADRHVALVRAVDAMAAVSLRGFLRRKWLQWLQIVARRRLREDQQRAALRMAAVTSRSLVRRYFTMWVNLEGEHNLRRRQIRTATALSVQSARILAGRAFSNWVEAGRRKKQRRMGAALVPRMAHDESVRLASRYYLKLWRSAMSRRDSRSRGQLEQMTRDLQRRFDALSNQVTGTMDKTQQTVKELEKKQQDQQQKALLLEQQQKVSNNNNDSSSPVVVAVATPLQPTTQSGIKDPSASAMQLGTHVSQMNMRGGGSGEVSRINPQQPQVNNNNNNNNNLGGLRSGYVGRPPGSTSASYVAQGNSNNNFGSGVPAQWLESPEAAWQQIKQRLENNNPKK